MMAMAKLSQQRCYNHNAREAVARCPACGRFYCRECVTEHDDKMLCSLCLALVTRKRGLLRGRWMAAFVLLLQGAAGWLVFGYAFYLIGKMLLAIPDDFHEGVFWQNSWLD